METMTRTWLEVGAGHHAHSPEKQKRLAGLFDRLEWVPPGEGRKEGMMAAMGIKATVEQFEIPNVSLYAVSHEMAPYGLYGIEANYANGRARLYVADEGDGIVPLCSDFWEAI